MTFRIRFVPARPLAACAAVVLLSGCATPSPQNCNPKYGGFVSGAAALLSDCYEQRLVERQARLQSTQSLTEQLRGENLQLAQERQDTSVRLAQAEQQLTALRRGNASLERQLEQLRSETAVQERRKAQLQGELNRINAEIAELQRQFQTGQIAATEFQEQIKRLTRERDRLASEIAAAVTGL